MHTTAPLVSILAPQRRISVSRRICIPYPLPIGTMARFAVFFIKHSSCYIICSFFRQFYIYLLISSWLISFRYVFRHPFHISHHCFHFFTFHGHRHSIMWALYTVIYSVGYCKNFILSSSILRIRRKRVVKIQTSQSRTSIQMTIVTIHFVP